MTYTTIKELNTRVNREESEKCDVRKLRKSACAAVLGMVLAFGALNEGARREGYNQRIEKWCANQTEIVSSLEQKQVCIEGKRDTDWVPMLFFGGLAVMVAGLKGRIEVF